MSLYGQQIGRQPFRPGQWSRYQGHSHKTYVQNNFYFGGGSIWGGGYGNYGNYYNQGCYGDTGMSKGAKWMLGLGGAATLLGTVLGFLGLGKKDKVAPQNEQVQYSQQRQEVQQTTEPERRTTTEPLTDEVTAPPPAKKPVTSPLVYTPDAKKIEDVTEKEHSYTVRSQIVNGQRQSDNPYNIVMALYKRPDGKQMTHSEIMAVRNQIFGTNVGLKVGEIKLPDTVTVTVNNINYKYKYNENAKPEDVKLGDFKNDGNMSFYDQKPSTKKVGEKWVALVNGQVFDNKTYPDEESARKAATDKANTLIAEQEAARNPDK